MRSRPRLLLSLTVFCHAVATVAHAQNVEISDEIPGDFHARHLERNEPVHSYSQGDFDKYSWETFIALNWPANPDGSPMQGKNVNFGRLESGGKVYGDHPVVWESWKREYEVFRSDGQRPLPWGKRYVPQRLAGADKRIQLSGQSIQVAQHAFTKQYPFRGNKLWPADSITIEEALSQPNSFLASSIAKGHSWFQTEQPFDMGPLVDRDGHYARFEILINEPMFDYIVDNELYNIEGQESFAQSGKDIVFPCGTFKLDSKGQPIRESDLARPKTETIGSIVLKASWKILTPAEIQSGRYHMKPGVVWTPAGDFATGSQENDQQMIAILGLVGFHIVHKSENVIQWTWSTFEHVDNCPEKGEESTREYSFYHPDSKVGVNRPLDRPWDAVFPTKPEPERRRSQIVRQIPIAATDLNAQMHEKFRKINPRSVWQYYDLVSTQWPTRPARAKPRNDPNHCNVLKIAPADIVGDPAPVFLGNSTMESYIQGTHTRDQVPNASSNCMECHANATSHPAQFSDFTFILERAKKKKQ